MSPNDKPMSMSVKDYLIRKLAVKLMLNESVIEPIINHQFTEAQLAMRNNDSVEVSGFGRFIFNRTKAHKRMAQMLQIQEAVSKGMHNPLYSEKKREKHKRIFEDLIFEIEYLKPKLYGQIELLTDSGGMEEQVDSPSTSEGIDRSNEQTEDGDMQGMPTQLNTSQDSTS